MSAPGDGGSREAPPDRGATAAAQPPSSAACASACPSWRWPCWPSCPRSRGDWRVSDGPVPVARFSRGLPRPADGRGVPRHGDRVERAVALGRSWAYRRSDRQRPWRARPRGRRARRDGADAARQHGDGRRVRRDPGPAGGALHRRHDAGRPVLGHRPGAWLAGQPVHRVVWWWAGFLVLTIVGERLDLSRLQRQTAASRLAFVAAAGVLLVGLGRASLAPDDGMRRLARASSRSPHGSAPSTSRGAPCEGRD